MIFFEDENLNEITDAERRAIQNTSAIKDVKNELKHQYNKRFGTPKKEPDTIAGKAAEAIVQPIKDLETTARQNRLKIRGKYYGPRIAAGAAAAGAGAYILSDRNKKSNWKRNGCEGIKNKKERAACQKYLGPDKITAEDKEK